MSLFPSALGAAVRAAPSIPVPSTLAAAPLTTPSWTTISPMNAAHCCHAATLLNNGTVLVIGGQDTAGEAIQLVDIFSQDHANWTTVSTSNLLFPRQQHTATLLLDGRVLVAGGTVNETSPTYASAEIYDPATGQWTRTGDMHVGRADHSATLLPNGNVLVAGGYSRTAAGGGSIASAEIYSPQTGQWTLVPSMHYVRLQHSATLLLNNKVLIAGGYDGQIVSTVEIYDPVANSWTIAPNMHSPRTIHTATLLHDGTVLVAGGYSSSVEIYDPVTNSWAVANDMHASRAGHTATLLPDGNVLVAGGDIDWQGTVTNSVEIFSPATGQWTATASLNVGRGHHSAVTLRDGSILVAGGSTDTDVLNSAEVYHTPATGTVISDRTILENTSTGALQFSFSSVNPFQPGFQITATSSNQALIPNANLILGGSGGSRTITVTPTPTNAITKPTSRGSALITITARDGSTTETFRFTITVVAPPWLVLLYLNGDDGEINQDSPRFPSITAPVGDLLQRVQTMSYNPNMRLVVLTDLHGAVGDSTISVRDPAGLTDVTNLLSSDGTRWPGFPHNKELNTADPATIRSFVTWARRAYPDTRYSFLSLVDHGGGWAPDLNDAPGQPRGIRGFLSGGWRGMSIDFTSGGTSLSTRDTHRALQGLGLNVVFFDACLMGMLESAYEIRGDADYLVAGENLLFAEFPYDEYLSREMLPDVTTPRDLATAIVGHYNLTEDVTHNPFAIAAIDLAQLRSTVPNNLAARVDTLAQEILASLPAGSAPIPASDSMWQALLQAYTQAQKFDYDSSLAIDATDGYVDLADFARQLSTIRDIPPGVRQAANAVEDAVDTASNRVVIRSQPIGGSYRQTPWSLTYARGLSIYLPLGERDYRPTMADPNDPNKPLQPERQLTYYSDPAQLALTHDYPSWARLLTRVEANVTIIRAPGGQDAQGQVPASVQPATIDTRSFHTPAPIPVVRSVYLPLIQR